MKILNAILSILNLAIAFTGIWLVVRMMYTYNNPIPIGAMFIVLVCVKCCVEVLKQ